MNVFVLDSDKRKAAQYHCDKHIVKMVTETAQLLSTSYYHTLQAELAPYKISHYKHPWAIWARQSINNWLWLAEFGLELYVEYKYRYEQRDHSAGIVICKMRVNPPRLGQGILSPMPLCMPDEYKHRNVVVSYRNYYNGEKYNLFKWTNRPVPWWVKH